MVIPVVVQHFTMMLRRNLLYTAVTRARRLAILVGNAPRPTDRVRTNSTAQHTALDWTKIRMTNDERSLFVIRHSSFGGSSRGIQDIQVGVAGERDTLEMIERRMAAWSMVLVDARPAAAAPRPSATSWPGKAIQLLAEGVRDAAARAAHDYLYTFRGGRSRPRSTSCRSIPHARTIVIIGRNNAKRQALVHTAADGFYLLDSESGRRRPPPHQAGHRRNPHRGSGPSSWPTPTACVADSLSGQGRITICRPAKEMVGDASAMPTRFGDRLLAEAMVAGRRPARDDMNVIAIAGHTGSDDDAAAEWKVGRCNDE